MTPEQKHAFDILQQQIRFYLTANQPIPAERLKNANDMMSALFKFGVALGFMDAQVRVMQINKATLAGTADGDELAEILNDEIKKLVPP